MESESASAIAPPPDGVVSLAQVESLLRNLSQSSIESDRPAKVRQAMEALEGARLALLENEAIIAKVESGKVAGEEMDDNANEMQRQIDEMKANLARAIDSLPSESK